MSAYIEIVLVLNAPFFHSVHGRTVDDACHKMNVILSGYDKRISQLSDAGKVWPGKKKTGVPLFLLSGKTKRCVVSFFSIGEDGGIGNIHTEKSYGVRVEPYDGLNDERKQVLPTLKLDVHLDTRVEVNTAIGIMDNSRTPSVSKGVLECFFDLETVRFNDSFYERLSKPGPMIKDYSQVLLKDGMVVFDIWAFPTTGSRKIDLMAVKYITSNHQSIPCYKREFEAVCSIHGIKNT